MHASLMNESQFSSLMTVKKKKGIIFFAEEKTKQKCICSFHVVLLEAVLPCLRALAAGEGTGRRGAV